MSFVITADFLSVQVLALVLFTCDPWQNDVESACFLFQRRHVKMSTKFVYFFNLANTIPTLPTKMDWHRFISVRLIIVINYYDYWSNTEAMSMPRIEISGLPYMQQVGLVDVMHSSSTCLSHSINLDAEMTSSSFLSTSLLIDEQKHLANTWLFSYCLTYATRERDIVVSMYRTRVLHVNQAWSIRSPPDQEKILVSKSISLAERLHETDVSFFSFILATCGHMQICRILIESGAELLALNADGNMPYDICDDELTLDYIETQMDRIGITQEMIDQTRAQVETQMLNDLQILVKKKAQSSIRSIDDVLSYRNSEGVTPLHIASANGYQTVVEYLLNQRVSINLQDGDGWTPLHAAAFWCQQAVLGKWKRTTDKTTVRSMTISRPINWIRRWYLRENSRRTFDARFMRWSWPSSVHGRFPRPEFA